jgi:Spy/CpxP family protein refolding chaperone
MKRKLLFPLAVLALGTLAAGTVYAARQHGGRMMAAHVIGVIDEALDQNPLTPAQKQALEATLDKAMADAKAHRDERKADVGRALDLFTADTLDTAALDQLASSHLQHVREHVRGVVTEVHDVLTPAQRKELAAFLRERASEHGFHPGFGGW